MQCAPQGTPSIFFFDFLFSIRPELTFTIEKSPGTFVMYIHKPTDKVSCFCKEARAINDPSSHAYKSRVRFRYTHGFKKRILSRKRDDDFKVRRELVIHCWLYYFLWLSSQPSFFFFSFSIGSQWQSILLKDFRLRVSAEFSKKIICKQFMFSNIFTTFVINIKIVIIRRTFNFAHR